MMDEISSKGPELVCSIEVQLQVRLAKCHYLLLLYYLKGNFVVAMHKGDCIKTLYDYGNTCTCKHHQLQIYWKKESCLEK